LLPLSHANTLIISASAAAAAAAATRVLTSVLQVNLVSSFNIVKAAVKGMIKQEGQEQHQQSGTSSTSSSPGRRGGGSIVLVSAALASHGIPNYEAMSAAKSAVEGEVRMRQAMQLLGPNQLTKHCDNTDAASWLSAPQMAVIFLTETVPRSAPTNETVAWSAVIYGGRHNDSVTALAACCCV
jgi:hypothetical protein